MTASLKLHKSSRSYHGFTAKEIIVRDEGDCLNSLGITNHMPSLVIFHTIMSSIAISTFRKLNEDEDRREESSYRSK